MSKEEKAAYAAGYDCGLNGVTESNCDFKFFMNPNHTKEWERGKKDGEAKRDEPLKVKSTYLFPNGMVVTFGFNCQQIPSLQGQLNKRLYTKIKKHSDEKTIWYGFENIKVK
ncbi:MAG: hypothetical protein V4506_19175 [Bacteroidota bacterium]